VDHFGLVFDVLIHPCLTKICTKMIFTFLFPVTLIFDHVTSNLAPQLLVSVVISAPNLKFLRLSNFN